MNPINFPAANLILHAPNNWDPSVYGPCNALPTVNVGSVYKSFWHVPMIDRIKILFGMPISLSVIASAHPPVAIAAEKIPSPENKNAEAVA